MKRRVTEILNELCIPCDFKGREFLRHAILICVDDFSAIHEITGRLYPEVARRCGSTGAKVERGIRYAIERAFDSAPEITLRKYLRASKKTGKVTNGCFIASIADMLRLELEDVRGA